MKLKTVNEAPIRHGTRVILRVDFDVAVKNGKILDDFRIRQALPTIQYLLRHGAQVLILTKRGHFGVKRSREASTKVLLPHLEHLLKEKIHFMPRLSELKRFLAVRDSGQLFLFENLRFWPGEERGDLNFAKRFAKTAEIYVSDNFGTAHRAHASVVGIPQFLPSYAGFLLEREVRALEGVVKNPHHPLVAIIGGAKLETKLPLIRLFLKIGDAVLVGGALANEFRQEHFWKRTQKLVLPCDGRKGTDGKFADIGPETIRLFLAALRRAKMVVWNGPLGRAEIPRFAEGTKAIARALARLNAFTVVGGGDTVAILQKYRLLRGFNHVSTGGGAMLEFLAGKKLPGIEVLKKS